MNYMATYISYTLSVIKILGLLLLNAGNDNLSSLFLILLSSTYSLQVYRVTVAFVHTQFYAHTHTHTHTHSVGLIWTRIGHSQGILPDKTQHSQETDIHAPRRDWNPQSQQAGRLQTDALDRAASGRQEYPLCRIPHRRSIQIVHRNPRKPAPCHK